MNDLVKNISPDRRKRVWMCTVVDDPTVLTRAMQQADQIAKNMSNSSGAAALIGGTATAWRIGYVPSEDKWYEVHRDTYDECVRQIGGVFHSYGIPTVTGEDYLNRARKYSDGWHTRHEFQDLVDRLEVYHNLMVVSSVLRPIWSVNRSSAMEDFYTMHNGVLEGLYAHGRPIQGAVSY